MFREFIENIREKKLAGTDSKILLAVSGGIDSMVMSHLFIKAGITCGIAHCNFNLRGRESDLDEAFVKRFAGKHHISFHSVSFDTTGYAEEKGISIQMAARELRYRWFEEIRSANGYSSVAVAHNLDDNVETFLINLTRGTGLAGLTGMRPEYNSIIRPLLFASRKAITAYAEENSISFREDRSNSEVKYVRNKIRHRIVPLFNTINPSFSSAITETAERLGEVNEIFRSYIADVEAGLFIAKGETITCNLALLRKKNLPRSVLFELFRKFGLGSHQPDELIKLINARTGSRLMTRTHLITLNRGQIVISRLSEEENSSIEIADLKDLKATGLFSEVTMEVVKETFKIDPDQAVAMIDADKFRFPLTIRKWNKGDFFYPLGMSSRKKLSDFFADRKYSVNQKEKVRLLTNGKDIIWIIGERIDNRFRITKNTRKILKIKTAGKS